MDDPNSGRRLAALKQEIASYEEKLKKNRPILVGHNKFIDLFFIYRTFIGPLPGELEDFQQHIHYLFPRIVDTKYMVTRGGHDMLPDENLQELFSMFKSQDLPAIEFVHQFGYRREAAHQAGYDSKL